MLHFTDYYYENNHRGVYPLDTNSEGVLLKFAGGYEIEPEYLTQWPNGKDPDFDEDDAKHRRELLHCDREYR